MIKIPLTQGKFALIDDEDYSIISLFKWCANKDKDDYYAHTKICFPNEKICIKMSRLIANAPTDKQVDHRNHNTLDNRKQNLRICTNQQNSMNRKAYKNTSSKYKGVHFTKTTNKWKAEIYISGKKIHIGYFHEEDAAAQAYNFMAHKYHGEFAYYNDVGMLK